MQGLDRFEYYLRKVQELLSQSAGEQNPGWWLYINGLRTHMFMLEGLAKLYSKLHDKKEFKQLQEDFKAVEDELGDIDYYHEYEGTYQKDPSLGAHVLAYFTQKKVKHIALFNDLLIDRNWLGSENNRIDRIRKKLADMDWLDDKEEIVAINKFYEKSIKSIKEFYEGTDGAFTDMEEDVHELRRKLRWLSIYPQALRGGIQLISTVPLEDYMQKYLVPEIVNSPFNQLPEKDDHHIVLLLEKNYFLALSWVIAELGKLKDAGLGKLVLQEAIKHSEAKQTEDANDKDKAENVPLTDELGKAENIVKTFFMEKNLDKLLAGISGD